MELGEEGKGRGGGGAEEARAVYIGFPCSTVAGIPEKMSLLVAIGHCILYWAMNCCTSGTCIQKFLYQGRIACNINLLFLCFRFCFFLHLGFFLHLSTTLF